MQQQHETIQKNKTLSFVKELPQALAERHGNDDSGYWTFITREIVDTSGDVVRVDGVDFSTYHNPPESHLKILAQHLRVLPDGTPPIIGRVEDVVRTTVDYKGERVKALAVWVRWATDGEGNITDLAKKYRDLYQGGFIDQMSVGIMVSEYADIPETGGMDIIASSIFEASMVTIPANAAATVIKELKDTLGDMLELPEKVPAAEKESPEGPDMFVHQEKDGGWIRQQDHEQIIKDIHDAVDAALVKQLADAVVRELAADPYGVRQIVEGCASALEKSINQMVERFDVLESAIVLLSASAQTRETAHRKQDESAKQLLESANSRLDRTLKYLSN